MNRHELPERLRGMWIRLERDYRAARAQLESAATYSDATHNAFTDAIDAILLAPAETAADIRLKIEVIRDHDIFDEWWCAEEAAAMLAIDAGRILPTRQIGGAA